MSYALAYTTQFHSIDDTPWSIMIAIDGFEGDPLEISLEADEPCVIEWQETSKTDVVQSSICTLRVSNESDRQMLPLMSRPATVITVFRDEKVYWCGYLDDAVYEEPYSYTDGYVTELTFSDFGILNRIPFTLTGKQSVNDIVRDCLASTALGNAVYINLYTSLLHPKTQQPITLDMLYINADRFEPAGDSWNAMTTKREVLEEVLRPLGLRIMQKNGQVYIYDIEYLRDNDVSDYIVWKGTDAYLKGSETFGRYEVAFEPDTVETLVEDELDHGSGIWDDSKKYFVKSYDMETDTESDIGFYLEVKNYATHGSKVQKSSNARFFRTRSVFADSNDIGIAWRIQCKQVYMEAVDPNTGQHTPYIFDKVLVCNRPVKSLAETETVFSLETGYLPVIPDRDNYQLRVNLDFLLSFRDNPFDDPPDEWVEEQEWYDGHYGCCEHSWRRNNFFAHMLPVKLEVVDENGNAIWHYKNANAEDIEKDYYGNTVHVAKVAPKGIGYGEWVSGAAGSWADMFLSYYKDYDPDDEDRDPLVTSGWVGNRIAMSVIKEINGTLYRVRHDGEYLPLPPVAGRLRLTIGDGVFPFYVDGVATVNPACYYWMAWQLYRNPKITIVKADRKDDGIDTDSVYEREKPRPTEDNFSETVKAGTWHKGIAPSARGLFFDASGNVWEKFIKNSSTRTLEKHRLRCLEDQNVNVHPVLSGTAELDIQFRAKREGSTPGIFLVTALRQNLQQDTEQVTMARIADVGGFCYDYHWSEPICVQVDEIPYSFAWSEPICVQVEEKP